MKGIGQFKSFFYLELNVMSKSAQKVRSETPNPMGWGWRNGIKYQKICWLGIA